MPMNSLPVDQEQADGLRLKLRPQEIPRRYSRRRSRALRVRPFHVGSVAHWLRSRWQAVSPKLRRIDGV